VSGRIQPAEHDPLCGGYMIHHCRPVDVRVAAGERRADAAASDSEAMLYDMNAFAERNAQLPIDVDLEFAAGAGI
jgi:hypothetical protein